ncbi:MAG: hypothetical protein ACREJ3_16720 [Polyangiaceae bacterium]
MSRYEAGALSDAIATWEPIYAQLGEEEGYRLAYDLGVAYAASGDATRAADRLRAFLAEVDARRAHGLPLAPIVLKEEADARARLTEARRTPAKVPGPLTTPTPTLVPAQTQTPAQTLVPTPAPTPTLVPTPATTLVPAPVEHPVSPVFIGVSGGLALAWLLAAIPLEAHANTLRAHDVNEMNQSPSHSIPSADRDSFTSARTWAYAMLGGAVGLGAVTAALSTWYVLGASPRRGSVIPSITPEHGGASLHLTAQF